LGNSEEYGCFGFPHLWTGRRAYHHACGTQPPQARAMVGIISVSTRWRGFDFCKPAGAFDAQSEIGKESTGNRALSGTGWVLRDVSRPEKV